MNIRKIFEKLVLNINRDLGKLDGLSIFEVKEIEQAEQQVKALIQTELMYKYRPWE